MILILMGVTGAGKTTLGQLLSEKLRWEFIEGDDYHSSESVRKMSQGIALADDDRGAWIEALREILRNRISYNRNVILTCSALKEKYRTHLKKGMNDVVFIYLKINEPTSRQRLLQRTGHFMSTSLIQSQFETLEEPDPDEVLTLNALLPMGELLKKILMYIKGQCSQITQNYSKEKSA